MKGLFTTRTAALKATIIDSSKIYAKNVILNGENLKDKFDNLEQIIRELEIKRPKISNVSFTFGEIKNGSIEHLSFVDGEIIATIDTKFHLIQMTIDGERVSSPILKTENGWVVRVYEEDASEEDIEFLYPNLTDDSEFSLLFVSSGDDIDDEGGTGGGLCDCEPYELTAEAVQKVVPMAWGEYTTVPVVSGIDSIAIGNGATADYGVSIGVNSKAGVLGGVAVGERAKTTGDYGTSCGRGATSHVAGVAFGSGASGAYNRAMAFGYNTVSKTQAITIGSQFSDTSGDYTCTTEGTGSITIGAGANTKNTTKTVDGVETTVESSNSVTIGCKASNQGADSVLIGASSETKYMNCVVIGAGITDVRAAGTVAVGKDSRGGGYCVAVGQAANADVNSVAAGYMSSAKGTSVAIGRQSTSSSIYSTAIGYDAKAADEGTVVFSSHTNGLTHKTQLYFAGANTQLANEYYNGEAFMGYVVTDKSGNKLACGTRRLSELFPDNSMAQPATLDEFGEWVQPKVFHPSDLDLPIEEPIEEEEYQPLPVYPIVEPEIDDLMIQE